MHLICSPQKTLKNTIDFGIKFDPLELNMDNWKIPAQSLPSQTTLNKHICFGSSAKSSNTSLKYICFARPKSLAKTSTFAEFHNICTLNSDTDQRPLFRFTQLPPPNFHSVAVRDFVHPKRACPVCLTDDFRSNQSVHPWWIQRFFNGMFTDPWMVDFMVNVP